MIVLRTCCIARTKYFAEIELSQSYSFWWKHKLYTQFHTHIVEVKSTHHTGIIPTKSPDFFGIIPQFWINSHDPEIPVDSPKNHCHKKQVLILFLEHFK